MAKANAAIPTGTDVLVAARERVADCFDRFDHVCVSFSGGKDSTAVLNLALDEARRRGRVPLDVVFWDEECIPPETVEYCERVAALPDVSFRWFCLPIQHRNACSKRSPYWYPWHPDDRDKWVRELPPRAITYLPGFVPNEGIPPQIGAKLPPSLGRVVMLLGIRAQESITRRRAITQGKSGDRAYYVVPPEFPWVTKAYPIYDWTWGDVWHAPYRLGWDYNRTYDVHRAAGISTGQSRVAPPFGEQPFRKLWVWKVCWPHLWDRMVARVPGAATGLRYANSELYLGKSSTGDGRLTGESWREWVTRRHGELDPSVRDEVWKCIRLVVSQHGRYTDDVMPDAEPHPRSGYCWAILECLIRVGGDKLGRQGQRISAEALANRRRSGGPICALRPGKRRHA
jgi:predicted phosphoadenosine phosphosulfate sulfurtransferase